MENIKVVCLGDSITAGAGATSIETRWTSLLAKRKEFSSVYNCGISGTRIAKRKGVSESHMYDLSFNMRVEILPDDADYVIVFGGTNDYGHGVIPFGEKGDQTEYTYIGAINCLIDKLIAKYGKQKLRFILPLRRFEEDRPNRPTLKKWVDAQREILEERGIIYLDLYKNGFSKPTSNANEGYFADGLHLNDEGNKKIEEYIYEFLIKTK